MTHTRGLAPFQSIFLIVKGAPEAALEAARLHGISAHAEGTVAGGHTHSYLRGPVEAHERAERWFHEDMGRTAPFPEGALLWYAYSPRPLAATEESQ